MIKSFTLREDRLLGKYRAAGMYWDEVAELLDRPELEVCQRAAEIELPSRRVWAPDELQFLQENYRRLPTAQIAKELRRSVSSVRGATCRRAAAR